VYNPLEQIMEFFREHCMAFGHVAAVSSFLRVGEALRQIGTRLLGVCLTSYFDDFCQLEAEASCEGKRDYWLEMLELLGWKVATEPTKLKPFAREFEPLGVVVSVQSFQAGLIHIRNKPSRVEGLEADVGALLQLGSVSAHAAAQLKGRIAFAEQQCLGKCAAVAARVLQGCSTSSSTLVGRSQPLRAALLWILAFLKHSPPRTIRLRPCERPFVLFTDGACETVNSSLVASCGAALVCPSGAKLAFGLEVPAGVVSRWTATGSRQVIGQAELLPILYSLLTWEKLLAGQRLIVFIDNDAARWACIRGSSQTLSSAELLFDLALARARTAVAPWFARVNTASNPGDAPSRLNLEAIRNLGFEVVEVVRGAW
jgi:hypothetical protein